MGTGIKIKSEKPLPDWMSSINDPLEKKIEKTLEVLRKAEAMKDKDLPFIINFSGGKDSMAILTLVRKVTDNIECVYVDGGMDVPGTVDYVKERCEALGVKLNVVDVAVQGTPHRKDGPLEGCKVFADYVRRYKYFPSAGSRWCSTWLKHRPMKTYWRTRFGKDRVLVKMNGVRMYESNTRLWKYGNPKHALRHCVEGDLFFRYDREHPPCILVYPILQWTNQNVIDYLKQENIPLHSGYKYFGVSGCKWCPVHTPDIYARILEKNPNLYDDIIELEEFVGRPCVRGGIWLKDIKADPKRFL